MAFEAFRAQAEAPARAGRKRLWYAVSIAFHGALIAAGVVYSFWHIEELSPPLLKVTFLSAAPPPPPAAPPPAGGGTTAPQEEPRQTEDSRAAEARPRAAARDAEEGSARREAESRGSTGREGRRQGRHHRRHARRHDRRHTRRHRRAARPAASSARRPLPPKFLPPNMAKQQLVSGADPPFPPSLQPRRRRSIACW